MAEEWEGPDDEPEPPGVGEEFVFEYDDGKKSRARIIEPPAKVWLYRVMLDDGSEISVVFNGSTFCRVFTEDD